MPKPRAAVRRCDHKAAGVSFALPGSFRGQLLQTPHSDAFGNTTSAPPAVLTVQAIPPRVTSQPAGQSVIWGQDALFTVAATGNPLPSPAPEGIR